MGKCITLNCDRRTLESCKVASGRASNSDGLILSIGQLGYPDAPLFVSARLHHQAHPWVGAERVAASLGHRARGHRSRRRLVGRRPVHRQSGLEQAPGLRSGQAVGRGAAIPGRPGRRALRHARRLEDHLGMARPAARGLGLSQGPQILRDDHSEAVRRARLLRLRAFGGDPQTVVPVALRSRHRDGAELARSRRTADAIRHQGAAGLLAAAARPRRRNSLLRPDQPGGRIGRRLDDRFRRGLPRHL